MWVIFLSYFRQGLMCVWVTFLSYFRQGLICVWVTLLSYLRFLPAQHNMLRSSLSVPCCLSRLPVVSGCSGAAMASAADRCSIPGSIHRVRFHCTTPLPQVALPLFKLESEERTAILKPSSIGISHSFCSLPAEVSRSVHSLRSLTGTIDGSQPSGVATNE